MKPKICWKAVGRRLTFALVEEGVFLSAPASFIGAGIYNEYILTILRSKVAQYYIYQNSDKTGAGDIMLNIQSLVRFPVPHLIENLDISNVYDLYNLSPMEISYMEDYISTYY